MSGSCAGGCGGRNVETVMDYMLILRGDLNTLVQFGGLELRVSGRAGEREENTEDIIPPLVKQQAMPRKTQGERERRVVL